MRPQGLLGGLALCTLVLAATMFAIVDASTSAACVNHLAACARESGSPIPLVMAIVGTVALIMSVIPTAAWALGSGRFTDDDSDDGEARADYATVAAQRAARVRVGHDPEADLTSA